MAVAGGDETLPDSATVAAVDKERPTHGQHALDGKLLSARLQHEQHVLLDRWQCALLRRAGRSAVVAVQVEPSQALRECLYLFLFACLAHGLNVALLLAVGWCAP